MAEKRISDEQVAEAIDRLGSLAAAARELNYEPKNIRKRAKRSPVIQAALDRRPQAGRPGRLFKNKERT